MEARFACTLEDYLEAQRAYKGTFSRYFFIVLGVTALVFALFVALTLTWTVGLPVGLAGLYCVLLPTVGLVMLIVMIGAIFIGIQGSSKKHFFSRRRRGSELRQALVTGKSTGLHSRSTRRRRTSSFSIWARDCFA